MKVHLGLVPAILFFVAQIQAQQQNNTSNNPLLELPTCALKCIGAVGAPSTCSFSDTKCICDYFYGGNAHLNTATACIIGNCTTREALFARNYSATTCDQPIRDRGNKLAVIAITLGVLTGVFVILRFITKVFITETGLHAEDWTSLATFLCGLPGTVFVVAGEVSTGIGRDIWTIPYDDIAVFVRWFYIVEIIYLFEISLLKLSLLIFYLRIFSFDETVRRVLIITIIFDVLWGVASVFTGIFQCWPIDFFWHGWDLQHKGSCIQINAFGWVNAAISIALDLWMLAIPLYQLRGLNMHWTKKLGVALMFCVGTFVTVVSILRLTSLHNFVHSANITWDNFDVTLWSDVEINVGIMCTCMPSLRLLLAHIFPKISGSRRSSSSKTKPILLPWRKNREAGVHTLSSLEHGASKETQPGPNSRVIRYQMSFNIERSQNDGTVFNPVGFPEFVDDVHRGTSCEVTT